MKDISSKIILIIGPIITITFAIIGRLTDMNIGLIGIGIVGIIEFSICLFEYSDTALEKMGIVFVIVTCMVIIINSSEKIITEKIAEKTTEHTTYCEPLKEKNKETKKCPSRTLRRFENDKITVDNNNSQHRTFANVYCGGTKRI